MTVYEPGMNRFHNAVRRDQCRASVYGNYTTRQCGNSGKYVSADGLWYCEKHLPENIAERTAKRIAEREERSRRDAVRIKHGLAQAKCHEDAMALIVEMACPAPIASTVPSLAASWKERAREIAQRWADNQEPE